MEDLKLFDDICAVLNLGKIKRKIKSVSGGYMHKMYYLCTEKGEYAVKLLNPVIMKRSDVFENYRIAEELEYKLEKADLPIVAALEFNGTKMQCIDNQYFYVFNWVNGKSLKNNKISKKHCEIIGQILARIHKLESLTSEDEIKKLNIDWDLYISKACKQNSKISKTLINNREILYEYQDKGNAALEKLHKIKTICNGDMDSKNVLWVDGKPQIIDLESLSYSNPYVELFQLALCWCGYESCSLKYDLLEAFVRAYIDKYGPFEIDWDTVFYSNLGRLEWLEYNIKRALFIECNNKKEQKLGAEQVKETMKHILYYDKIHYDLVNRLHSITKSNFTNK
ncbi:MAG: phosphotransferase [Eubacterium sp.]|nr:phosphotransferase [Eubacterium sp.]